MTRRLTIIALSLLLGILPAWGRGEYEVRGPQGGVVASMLAGLLAQEGADAPHGLILLAPGEVIKEATRAGTFLGQKFDPADPPEYIKCWGLYKLGRDYLVQTQELDIYGVSSSYQGLSD